MCKCFGPLSWILVKKQPIHVCQMHAAMVDAFSEERLRSEGNEDGLVIQVIEELKQLKHKQKG